MRLRNHFETGANGSRITAFGSSNPYPWDFVAGSVTTSVYDNTHARGLMAGKFLTDGTAAKAMATWTPTGGQYGTQTEVYGRMYVWLSAYPSAITSITAVTDSTNSMACRAVLLTDGKLRITNATGTTAATSLVSMPTAQWVRLEWHIVHSPTTGIFTLRAYWTDPSAPAGSYDVQITGSALNTLASSGGAQFGWCDPVANLPALWLDAVEVNTAGWVGPSVSEPAPTFIAWRTPVLGPVDQSNDSQLAVNDYVTRLIEDVAPSRLTFVSEPRRRGAMSLRMELHQYDTTHGGGSERLTLNRAAPVYGPGNDFWLGVSVLLDPTYPSSLSSYWMVLYQLFGMTGGYNTGSPPFALEIGSNDYFQMSVRGGVKATDTATAPRESCQNIAPVTKGVWHDFLFHIFLSLGSDGSVDCYYKLASDPDWPDTPTVSDSGMNVLTVTGVVQLIFNSMNLYRKSRPEIAVAYFGLAVVQPDRELVEPYFDSAVDVRLPGSWGLPG